MPGRRRERTEMASLKHSEFWLCYRPFGDDCDAVRMVDEARAAVARDTASRALEAGFQRVRVFSTVELNGLTVERTRPGQLVGDIIAAAARDTPGAVCYAGSGMPAMSIRDWFQVRATIESGQVVANRMFSCDWVAVPSARTLSVSTPSPSTTDSPGCFVTDARWKSSSLNALPGRCWIWILRRTLPCSRPVPK